MKKTILFACIAIWLMSCDKDNNEVNYNVEINCNDTIRNDKIYEVNSNITPEIDNINNVELFLDENSICKKIKPPFSFSLTLNNLKTGEHTLLAIATLNDGSAIKSREKRIIFSVGLGEEYQGGVVIKTTNNGLNGIIAAKSDLTGGVLGKFKYGAYNGNYQAYNKNDGFENTQKFIDKFDNNYAAIACLNLDWNGYSDWFLPSYNEMLLFEEFLQELNIPERSGRIYWSSTGDESNVQRAYAVPFGVLFGTPCDMQSYYFVRPCRQY